MIIIGTSDTLWSTRVTVWIIWDIISTSWAITRWGIDSVRSTRRTIRFKDATLGTFVRTFFTDVSSIIPVIWTDTSWWLNSVL
jgi:hypothetical protein